MNFYEKIDIYLLLSILRYYLYSLILPLMTENGQVIPLETFTPFIAKLVDRNNLDALYHSKSRIEEILKWEIAISSQPPLLNGQKALTSVQSELNVVNRAIKMVLEKLNNQPKKNVLSGC